MKQQLISQLWPVDARIIEFGATDGALGDCLVAAGGRYLGVVDRERQAQRLALQHPRLGSHLAVCRRPNRVRQNNADVLVLNRGTAAHLRRYRDVRHARFVACPLELGATMIWAVLFGLGQFLLGRLAWPRLARVGKTWLVVFRVRRPRPYTAARRFIPHALGIVGVLGRLRTDKLRHVVLRWFESLPQLPAGEDLDLVVDDEDLGAVRELLNGGPGLQPVDLYSVHGAPGADYQKMPYYPPDLAEQLLDRSIVDRGLCRVPSPRDHFLSLAYHAVYHKGLASGLRSRRRRRPSRKRPEHDYEAILGQLARRLAIDVPILLEDLDNYLAAVGWRPPQEMLVRLARKNAWLRGRLKLNRKRTSSPAQERSRAA